MWTRAELVSNAVHYQKDIWRMVETEAKATTMRLVDTLEEQAILENLIEDTKPPVPPECAHLDVLLYTPFRYTPYPIGSRFRHANQPEGAFYGAETIDTLVAENAFHAVLFYAESPGTKLPSTAAERTVFCVPTETAESIDLTAPPLNRDSRKWTDLTDYGPCQNLADMARSAQIKAIRYRSVRDPDKGVNVAVLSCGAFAADKPSGQQTWHIMLKPKTVQLWRENPRNGYEVHISDLANDPRIATYYSRSNRFEL